MMMVRPVADPAIPVEVCDALLAHAEGLRPGSGTPPLVLPGGRRRAARDVVQALGLGAVCALLPVVLVFTPVFGFAVRMVAVAGLVGRTGPDGTGRPAPGPPCSPPGDA